MKSFKLFVATLFLSVLAVPVFSIASVSAEGGILQCQAGSGEFVYYITEGCDLAVDKKVSINGGALADADTSADAAQANVGDAVTWQITVSDVSNTEGSPPVGIVQVGDNLPAGVTYVSSTASDGSTYDQSSDVWQFSLNSSTAYPVTLTISTTAASTGLAQNFAFLSGYFNEEDCLPPSFFCEYSDSNNVNDGDNAWAEISAKPVVLGESTPVVLAATGNGLAESLVAGSLILTTFGLLGFNRFARKES